MRTASKQRSNIEILRKILATIESDGEIRFTPLMQKTNLTYMTLSRRIEQLQHRSLIQVEEEPTKRGFNRTLKLTSAGRQLLRKLYQEEENSV